MNKLKVLDLISNRNETVQNTGDSWNHAAYGNCLIDLNHAKITDALYLFNRHDLDNVGMININNMPEAETSIRSKATRIIDRQ